MIDVGAASGYYTKIMLERSPGSLVLAIEPFPGNIPHFVKDVGSNPRVVLVQAAAAEARGWSKFFVASTLGKVEGFWAGHEGYSSLGQLVPNNDTRPTIDVLTLRIDDLIDEPVRFMKIDVQGSELRVLNGASRLFANHRIDFMYVEHMGEADVLHHILSLGYYVLDSTYIIVPKANADLSAWDIVSEGALSTGTPVFTAWPRKLPTEAADYPDFFRDNTRDAGSIWTDLVCVHESAIDQFHAAVSQQAPPSLVP
jgi:FkbM family methyltransferase